MNLQVIRFTEELILVTYVSLPTFSCKKNNCSLPTWWDRAPMRDKHMGVVVSGYEMSSPWRWPKAEGTPENMVPRVPPDLWHRRLTSANPLRRASSQESERPSITPRLDERVSLFCIVTHYFKHLPRKGNIWIQFPPQPERL